MTDYLWRAADAVETALDAGADDLAGALFDRLLEAVDRELVERGNPTPVARSLEAELLVAEAARLGERVKVRR